MRVKLDAWKKRCYHGGTYECTDDDVHELYRIAHDAIKAAPVRNPEICGWRNNDGFWSTGCGKDFVLYDGTPYQNGMRFCYHCGRKLRAVAGYVAAEKASRKQHTTDTPGAGGNP